MLQKFYYISLTAGKTFGILYCSGTLCGVLLLRVQSTPCKLNGKKKDLAIVFFIKKFLYLSLRKFKMNRPNIFSKILEINNHLQIVHTYSVDFHIFKCIIIARDRVQGFIPET